MSADSTPQIVVDERVELAVSLLGIVAVAAAAYHAGRTGESTPLYLASTLLALVVLFVTSES